MPENKLPSVEELWRTFDYNPSTGMLTWRNDRFNPSGRLMAKAGSQAGNLRPDGRRSVRLLGVNYYAHRIAWKMAHRTEPPVLIDHIDRNPCNNAISNLRAADKSLNALNIKKAKVCGVNWVAQKGKWQARISDTHLGYFANYDDAVAARQRGLTK